MLKTVNIPEAMERLVVAAESLRQPIAFMEVCGTHTVAAFRCGLHSLMPQNVRLISGPGCPVCVTAQGDIDQMIDLGASAPVTLCTYGDMLRVTGQQGSLEAARSRGADVRVIYSAMDAVELAAAEPNRQVVFAAVGFETTTGATAAAVRAARQRGLKNFSVLASHKLVMPAVKALLDGGQVKVQGFLLPGHVSVIIGADAYEPIAGVYGLPAVIGGFEPVQIAAALARLTEMVRDGVARIENLYTQAVTPAGNCVAQKLIDSVFEPCDVAWRGLGVIPGSGLKLRAEFADFDAAARFKLQARNAPEPAGCRCGEVICGQMTPIECGLFGKVCTPMNPVGPCMVSSEGTCQAWFKYRRQQGRQGAGR